MREIAKIWGVPLPEVENVYPPNKPTIQVYLIWHLLFFCFTACCPAYNQWFIAEWTVGSTSWKSCSPIHSDCSLFNNSKYIYLIYVLGFISDTVFLLSRTSIQVDLLLVFTVSCMFLRGLLVLLSTINLFF